MTRAPRERTLTQSEVLRVARTWIGTPYHHQASTARVGCDCLGLIRGVWRDLYGRQAATPPPYSRDWAEAGGREALLDAAHRHLAVVSPAEMLPGDVLIFRFRLRTAAKHAAILATPGTMIHAMEGAGVQEVPLSAWWRRRIAGVFSFPENAF